MALRLVFLGNDPWSVPSLEAVARSPNEVTAVVTREPRPAGRGGSLRPTAVAEAARGMGLPLREVRTVKEGEGLEAVRAASPDVLVVVAYGEILPAEVLEIPRLAPINVHFSLLPALRGADPVRRAILEGLSSTGVTIIRMDEGMDTGPILLGREEPIGPEDDAGSLGDRLARVGGALLVEALDLLESGRAEEREQDDERATTAPKIPPEEEWIDWSHEPEAVVRRIRALAPDPGARTRFRGRVLKAYVASPGEGAGEPGTVVAAPDAGLVVAAGGGAVRLEEVLPEGKRRMSGSEFVRGYRPEPGERLG